MLEAWVVIQVGQWSIFLRAMAGTRQVWADPDISGIEPAEATYNADAVHNALRKSLIAFGDAYPERSDEVKDVLRRYSL